MIRARRVSLRTPQRGRAGVGPRERLTRVRARSVRPQRDVGIEVADSRDGGHLASLFHRPIPGELTLRLGPGLLRAVPAGQRVAGLDIAGYLGRDAQADLAAAHLR